MARLVAPVTLVRLQLQDENRANNPTLGIPKVVTRHHLVRLTCSLADVAARCIGLLSAGVNATRHVVVGVSALHSEIYLLLFIVKSFQFFMIFSDDISIFFLFIV